MSEGDATPNGGGNQGGGAAFPWAEYNRLKDENIKRRQKGRDLQTNLDKATAEIEKLTLERNDFKQKFENLPNALKEENQKLVSQIRERQHKDAITGLLDDPKSGVKLRKDAVEAVLKVAGYDPERHQTDDGKPDVERIKATLAEAVKANPWAVAQSEGSDESPRPGPAGGRGAPAPRESEQPDPYASRETASGGFRL